MRVTESELRDTFKWVGLKTTSDGFNEETIDYLIGEFKEAKPSSWELVPNDKPLKTHMVLDLCYLPEEGQGCFVGTEQECNDFVSTQSPHFMYRVVPMLKEEIESYPDNKK